MKSDSSSSSSSSSSSNEIAEARMSMRVTTRRIFHAARFWKFKSPFPSPRPSPFGRGGIVSSLNAKLRLPSAQRPSEFQKTNNGYSLFPGQRVKVRGSGLCEKTIRIFALAAMILFFAASATAETTNTLSDAEIEGRSLAQKIFELQPRENFTNTGVVKVKDGAGKRFETRFEMRIKAELTNSFITYETVTTNASDNHEELSVCHPNNNKYSCGYGGNQFAKLESFANSDFSAYDLAMDFIYWPQQKVLKKELHRQCACTVLESTNPNPSTNGYSRVVSWIDEESLGIVEAYAYDVNGKQLKNFYPKDLKKVNGQYQVQTMIMKNLQTRSTTRLEFDLEK
jgi:hypothetical protein